MRKAPQKSGASPFFPSGSIHAFDISKTLSATAKNLIDEFHVDIQSGVDATKMGARLQGPYRNIIWNFPHTGIRGEMGDLLEGFFASARERLTPDGRVFLSLKNGKPYPGLKYISDLADRAGLKVVETLDFDFGAFGDYTPRSTSQGTPLEFPGGATTFILSIKK